MTIDYDSLLTVEQKKELIYNRIQQFAAEAYQTELNRESMVRNGVEGEPLAQCDEALAVLGNVIVVHQEKLAELDA
jgi:hypothetical protein